MLFRSVDYVLFGFRTITPSLNNLQDEVSFKEQLICSNKELKNIYVETFLLSKHGNGFPWNKFYRKSFLKEYNLLFENQRIQQDEVFNLNLYNFLDKAYISSEVLYTYYIYEKGNTRVRFIPERFDIYISVREHFEALINRWNLSDPIIEKYLNQRLYNGIITCLTYNLFHADNHWSIDEKKKEIDRIFKNQYSKLAIKNSYSVTTEQRIYLFFARRKNIFMLSSMIDLFEKLRSIKSQIK